MGRVEGISKRVIRNKVRKKFTSQRVLETLARILNFIIFPIGNHGRVLARRRTHLIFKKSLAFCANLVTESE